MTIIRYSVLGVLAVVLCGAGSGRSQDTHNHSGAKEKAMSTTTKFFSKGGIGIIAKGNLWVVVKSADNELIYGTARDRWRGLEASRRELIVFFEGKIWSTQNLPDRFDLSRSVVVSFETERIRFFDFHEMSGGTTRELTNRSPTVLLPIPQAIIFSA